MPQSDCPALHGVNPNEKKYYQTVHICSTILTCLIRKEFKPFSTILKFVTMLLKLSLSVTGSKCQYPLFWRSLATENPWRTCNSANRYCQTDIIELKCAICSWFEWFHVKSFCPWHCYLTDLVEIFTSDRHHEN